MGGLPPAATVGRRRLREPAVLLPLKGREPWPAPQRLTSSPPRNQLLRALSREDFALLQPHLRPIALGLKMEIERPNRRIDTVCFMEAGFASVVAVQSDDSQVEVGLIGSEGMPALPWSGRRPVAAFDVHPSRGRSATDRGANELRSAMNASTSLHALLFTFAQVFTESDAHTAIANARAQIDRRLARWILMAHD